METDGERIKDRSTQICKCTNTHLFAIMCDRGEDGTKCLETHSDIQKVGSKEEVVIMSQKRHGHVPCQVQEGL